MHRTALLASLVAACGTPAVASDIQLATAHPTEPGQTRHIGHVYYNASTGERIITRYEQPLGADQTDRPAQTGQRDAELNPVWLAQGANTCLDRQANPLFQADNPDREPSHPLFNLATRGMYLDWGDIPADTLIEAIGFTYAAQHDDPDSTGVPGFGATLIYRDGEDGNNDCCSSVGVLVFTLQDLPGNSGQFTYELWNITVDLLADPANPMSVEFGDTDGDSQGAAHFNSYSFVDSDRDGLHEFAHGISFHQPGTWDFDGDGVLDGDPAAAAATYLMLVAPEGAITQDPDDPNDDIITDIAPLPSAQGLEDGFMVYSNYGPDDSACPDNYLGILSYGGGFNCPNASDPEFRPFASIAHRLYNFSATTNPCPADVNDDGQLNFSDVTAFLGLFNSQDPAADLNNDGVVNFGDTVAFLNEFNAGCP